MMINEDVVKSNTSEAASKDWFDDGGALTKSGELRIYVTVGCALAVITALVVLGAVFVPNGLVIALGVIMGVVMFVMFTMLLGAGVCLLAQDIHSEKMRSEEEGENWIGSLTKKAI